MSALNKEYFQDEDSAREYMEKILWPAGPVCPHCENRDKIYKMNGKSYRKGLYKCGKCRKQFTVTVGTLLEGSKIKLHIWLQAIYLMCSSKKGFSAHQLHRTLGVTYKTAWFMAHRIREAFSDSVFTDMMGGGGRIVEIDETYVGGRQKGVSRQEAYYKKMKVFSLVERGGRVRSFHVRRVSGKTLKSIMQYEIHEDTHIMSDEMSSFRGANKMFKSHNVVCHGRGEYSRGAIHTNTIENYFSILKRGLVGIYQHCSPQHLRRYVGEFDFRYNTRRITDTERMEIAIRWIEGKRLVYGS